MTRSRITQSIARAVGSGEQRQRRVAAVARQRLVLELVQHALEQPALHRIVIDNENGHANPRPRAMAVPFRGTLAEEA